ncbi:hypothetical protein NKJ71_19480 [Mesorhizobium sp. M0050]|uniref:hypothetical protein n=1 Tax=Mesorhizobium sp. M0050 TaxID=2956861 RepID=UPI003335527A
MSNSKVGPSGFDVALPLTTTSGAYSANDIVGGLITFPVGNGSPCVVMVTGAQVGIKAAVTSTLTLLLFDSAPTNGGTTADNAALALAAADVIKLAKAIPVSTLFDCGTPNAYSADALNVPIRPVDGWNLYGLLIDGTGFTLTSTTDVTVRLRGVLT